MEHKVLRDSVLDGLNTIINQHLEAGWTLQGTMFMGIGIYCQCIVSDTDTETITISTWRYNELQDKEEILDKQKIEGFDTVTEATDV